MTFVLDASVTLGWLFPDERNAYPRTILGRLAHAPALVSSVWALEVANGLLVAERLGRVSTADASLVHTILKDLPVGADSVSVDAALGPILTVVRTRAQRI
ncbi:MAG: type II toxin-antitoxin system VapC family toxin [Chloroflexi bacterium]|nr:MAG: type II toxin-antitoxin system VapC family toxin [Chloroflexota bacterium]